MKPLPTNIQRLAAAAIFASACHVAHAFDLAGHKNMRLAHEDPRALTVQFVDADAHGLQTSSEHWPWVQRFTNWADAPGWDSVRVATSYQVGDAEMSGDLATVPVTYALVGTLTFISSPRCPTGMCNAWVEDKVTRKTTRYHLKRIDARWVIDGPQDGPIVNVRFAHDQAAQSEGRPSSTVPSCAGRTI